MPARGDDFKSAITRSTMKCLAKIFSEDGYVLVKRNFNSLPEARKALGSEKRFFPMELSIGIIEDLHGRVVDVAAMKANKGCILLSKSGHTTYVRVSKEDTWIEKITFPEGLRRLRGVRTIEGEDMLIVLAQGSKDKKFALIRDSHGNVMDSRKTTKGEDFEFLTPRGKVRVY